MTKGNIKDFEKGHESEPGFRAGIPHRPYRRRAPKHAVRGRAFVRVKKGPLESKG